MISLFSFSRSNHRPYFLLIIDVLLLIFPHFSYVFSARTSLNSRWSSDRLVRQTRSLSSFVRKGCFTPDMIFLVDRSSIDEFAFEQTVRPLFRLAAETIRNCDTRAAFIEFASAVNTVGHLKARPMSELRQLLTDYKLGSEINNDDGTLLAPALRAAESEISQAERRKDVSGDALTSAVVFVMLSSLPGDVEEAVAEVAVLKTQFKAEVVFIQFDGDVKTATESGFDSQLVIEAPDNIGEIVDGAIVVSQLLCQTDGPSAAAQIGDSDEEATTTTTKGPSGNPSGPEASGNEGDIFDETDESTESSTTSQSPSTSTTKGGDGGQLNGEPGDDGSELEPGATTTIGNDDEDDGSDSDGTTTTTQSTGGQSVDDVTTSSKATSSGATTASSKKTRSTRSSSVTTTAGTGATTAVNAGGDDGTTLPSTKAGDSTTEVCETSPTPSTSTGDDAGTTTRPGNGAPSTTPSPSENGGSTDSQQGATTQTTSRNEQGSTLTTPASDSGTGMTTAAGAGSTQSTNTDSVTTGGGGVTMSTTPANDSQTVTTNANEIGGSTDSQQDVTTSQKPATQTTSRGRKRSTLTTSASSSGTGSTAWYSSGTYTQPTQTNSAVTGGDGTTMTTTPANDGQTTATNPSESLTTTVPSGQEQSTPTRPGGTNTGTTARNPGSTAQPGGEATTSSSAATTTPGSGATSTASTCENGAITSTEPWSSSDGSQYSQPTTYSGGSMTSSAFTGETGTTIGSGSTSRSTTSGTSDGSVTPSTILIGSTTTQQDGSTTLPNSSATFADQTTGATSQSQQTTKEGGMTSSGGGQSTVTTTQSGTQTTTTRSNVITGSTTQPGVGSTQPTLTTRPVTSTETSLTTSSIDDGQTTSSTPTLPGSETATTTAMRTSPSSPSSGITQSTTVVPVSTFPTTTSGSGSGTKTTRPSENGSTPTALTPVVTFPTRPGSTETTPTIPLPDVPTSAVPSLTSTTKPPTSTVEPAIANRYCLSCLQRRNQKDLYVNPDDCHSYFQCAYMNETSAIATLRRCPRGTFWREDVLSCLPEGNIPCFDLCLNDTVATHGCYGVAGNCVRFFTCSNTASYGQCCPVGTRFDVASCNCVLDPRCRDECPPATVEPTREPIQRPQTDGVTCVDAYRNILRPSSRKRDLFELVDMSLPRTPRYTEIPCAPGSIFDINTCRCEISDLPYHADHFDGNKQCHLYMPFDNDFQDHSTNRFQTYLFGSADLSDETAVGDNGGSVLFVNGSIEIPGLKTIDFQGVASWCLFFRCRDGENSFECLQSAGLLSNNHDKVGCKHSIVIGSRTDNNIIAKLQFRNPSGGVTVSGFYERPTNGWIHVCVVYDGTFSKLYINGAGSNAAAAAGSLMINHCPYVIGTDQLLGNFHGWIDDVLVCGHAMTSDEIRAHFEGNRRYLASHNLIPS